jgi:simple sugar transport system permease protein
LIKIRKKGPKINKYLTSSKNYKSTLVMTFFSSLVLWFFGITGKAEDVAFELSRRQDPFQLDPIVVDSSALGVASGIIMIVITFYSGYSASKNIKTSAWLSTLFGLVGVTSMLGWLAAGNAVPISFILGTALALSAPLILGSMAGIMSERVGITNIAIEAQLLSGAFVSAVVATMFQSYTLALLSAMVAGALLSTILAVFSIRFLAQQIVVGVVLNVLVIGVTNFLYQQWLSEDAAAVNFPGTLDVIKIPGLSDIPVIGSVLFENRLTVFLAMLAVPVLWWVLFKTKFGLRARAVGEHPLAADTVGVNVGRTRFWWVVLGGSLAGLGGAAFTIGSAGAFGREMTGGLGFIALAVMILGRWHPVYAALAALLFGFSFVLRVWVNQVNPGIPSDLIAMIPYLVTIIAVVGFVGKSQAPKALAIPYVKG